MSEPSSSARSARELIGPFGPSPGLNPELWDDRLACDRCEQAITVNDEWFIDADADDEGPAYHGGCLVG